jgi:cytoskeletal protein CcmA (bactofilin family)
MIIPEGVIIEGSLTSSSDTDIGGRIEGNITVEGRLNLGPSALISGNIRAGSCKIEGLVEGKVECTEDLELGPTGRLNADVLAGKRIYLAGQVYGNVTTPGMLRLAATSRVEGDVRTRSIMVEEGATLNGQCTMRAPSQQQTQQPQKK